MRKAPEIDPNSGVWRAVSEWLDERIAQTRAGLERPEMDHETTTYERGRLAALRELKGLPEANLPSGPVTEPIRYT